MRRAKGFVPGGLEGDRAKAGTDRRAADPSAETKRQARPVGPGGVGPAGRAQEVRSPSGLELSLRAREEKGASEHPGSLEGGGGFLCQDATRSPGLRRRRPGSPGGTGRGGRPGAAPRSPDPAQICCKVAARGCAGPGSPRSPFRSRLLQEN